MSNWFYYNKKGDKVGPIPVSTLKLLAQQSVIGPDTIVENQNGRTSPAGSIKGLFPEMVAPLEEKPVKEPGTDEVYGIASPELPKPPPVEPRPVTPVPVASDPFTMPVNDSPFALAPSVEVTSAPAPAKKKSAKKQSVEQSAIEGSFVYAVEKWIRNNPALFERIIERVLILLGLLLTCFRVLPAFVLLLFLILWFAFDLVRQVKKDNADS